MKTSDQCLRCETARRACKLVTGDIQPARVISRTRGIRADDGGSRPQDRPGNGPIRKLRDRRFSDDKENKMRTNRVLTDIEAEVARAVRKFPTWPTDPLHALAVLGEEYGELNKSMLQLIYEPHKTCAEHVRTEAIQTAAMALRLAASLDMYQYLPSAQHKQAIDAAMEKQP